jgi:hypothetical protein
MKVRTLAVLAGVGTPLIATGAANATYLGIYAVEKPNPYGILTVCVYAEFDNPGGDWWESAGGTPQNPINITVLGGSFYNHKFGSDQAPSTALITVFPSLAYDSFFAGGIRAVAAGQVNHLNLINMPVLAGTSIHTSNGGWGLVPPTAAQGNPFDPINSFPGNGSVLVAQFSTTDGYGVRGAWIESPVSDGVAILQAVEFEYVIPAPSVLGAFGLAGVLGMRRRRRRAR